MDIDRVIFTLKEKSYIPLYTILRYQHRAENGKTSWYYMAKSLWQGDISFGLVSIPVSVSSVVNKNSLHFHLLDSKDKSRVCYKRVNVESGREVPWNEIVKGYEFKKGQYVVIEEEKFKEASPKAFKLIEIQEFVDIADVDILYFEKPYYLVPLSKNKKAYVLLRDALKKTKKVGVAKVIMHTQEHLSLILPHRHALLLNILRFNEDIRDENEFDFPKSSLKSYKISDHETKMAVDLIHAMSNPWKPEKYHDEYREMLMKWIKSEVKSGKVKTKRPLKKAENKENVVDFVALLKQSLKRKKRA